MEKIKLRHQSNKSLCNLLLLFCAVPHGLVSVYLGYHLSFISTEVEILRTTTTIPTATIELQSLLLWILFTAILFLWGFITLKIICECIYRLLSNSKNLTPVQEKMID